MILTEEEAREKLCPIQPGSQQSSQRRKCQASDCMLWVWWGDMAVAVGKCGLAAVNP